MEETEKKKKQTKYVFLLLFALILAQILYTSYVFAFQKGSLHSDEVYCYGLANSYYRPFIAISEGIQKDRGLAGTLTFNTDPETGAYIPDLSQLNLTNAYTWVNGDIFADYLSVRPDQRFSYGSVLYNQRSDVHPPLYYILLHTICSFFPGSFSRWYAFSLNLLCLAGTQVFLFLTARKISKSDTASLLTCLLYGMSTGALSTFIFLRQYSLATMLCMAFTYFAVDVIYQQRQSTIKTYIPSLAGTIICALLAFFTHYSTILYIGSFTALYCLYLLLHKRIRKMFLFGGSLLCTLLVFLALWPYLLQQTSSYDKGGTLLFSHWTQTKMLLRYFCQYCLGFSIPVLPTMFGRVAPLFMLIALICFGALLIPFRDELWCQNLIAHIKKLPGRLWLIIKNAGSPLLFIIPAALAMYPFTGYATNVPRMGNFVIRYLLPSFPMLCMGTVLIVYGILRRIPRISKVSYPLLALCVIASGISANLQTRSPFLLSNYGDCQDMTELAKDKNMVVIASDIQDVFKVIHCTAPYTYTTAQTYVTSADFLEYFADDIRNIDDDINYVIIQGALLHPDEANQAMADMLTQEAYLSDSSSYFLLDYLGVADEMTEEDYQRIVANLSDLFAENEANDVAARVDCSSIIKSFNDDCEYKILFGLNLQGMLFYVLELT